MEPTETLNLLRKREGWGEAVTNLSNLVEAHGDSARTTATDYARVYEGRRGAMVFDVVFSRRRNYKARVLPRVLQWEDAVPEPTLRSLAFEPLAASDYGLMSAEPVTMRAVAENLLTFSTDEGLTEDEGCRLWAREVDGLQHAHKLDPLVGSVSGIGPALFAYMRMRCGANALKPDVRVTKALRKLGFGVPGDGHSVMVVAQAAAAEVGLDLFSLDQLLWSRNG